jgi:hypothetical protein
VGARRGFAGTTTGYVDHVSSQPHDAPTGPANPHTSSGPDAPTAPGGPQRSDSPQGTTSPGGPDEPPTPPQPEVHPSSPPDGPQTIPVPPSSSEPTADGQIHARTQTEQVNEERHEENAQTSLDQPSDGSGSE